MTFNKLVELFKGMGYKVEIDRLKPHRSRPYRYAKITGKSILGGFCEFSGENTDCWYVNGRIAFDHVKCFDKWSKCPYSLELPKTEQEFQYIVDQMKYLRTKEGFEKSNGFEIRVKDYPFSTHVICSECRGMKRVSGKRTKKVEFKDGKPPMYVGISIKCPKCKGTGKIKRT
jgi:hypothetical protein